MPGVAGSPLSCGAAFPLHSHVCPWHLSHLQLPQVWAPPLPARTAWCSCRPPLSTPPHPQRTLHPQAFFCRAMATPTLTLGHKPCSYPLTPPSRSWPTSDFSAQTNPQVHTSTCPANCYLRLRAPGPAPTLSPSSQVQPGPESSLFVFVLGFFFVRGWQHWVLALSCTLGALHFETGSQYTA